MKENKLLKILREYKQGVERYDEWFFILCDYVKVNDFTFRNANDIHICAGVLWIDGVSVDVKDVETFSIIKIEGIKHDKKEITINIEDVMENE